MKDACSHNALLCEAKANKEACVWILLLVLCWFALYNNVVRLVKSLSNVAKYCIMQRCCFFKQRM